jgi:hypothetical protein
MHEDADFQPTAVNRNYRSIHVPRLNHGVIDFYLPLHFLFICETLSRAYPMYAITSQSIVLQINFANPLSFINTYVAVKPTVIDP